jgi:hypothetical protein
MSRSVEGTSSLTATLYSQQPPLNLTLQIELVALLAVLLRNWACAPLNNTSCTFVDAVQQAADPGPALEVERKGAAPLNEGHTQVGASE